MKKTVFLFLIGLSFLALPVRAQINLLHEFAGGIVDGEYPYGSLIISGSTIFGMTHGGGDSGYGTIFKIETDGTGFTLLYEFSGVPDDGGWPFGSLIISGSTLFGMTSWGGEGFGMVFKIGITGADFTVLHSFAGGSEDGLSPQGSLLISGSTLYGMTRHGGDSNEGTIFKIESNGTGFGLLHEFTGCPNDGRQPVGSLILSGTTLYGMTYYGGVSGYGGTIFKIEANGSGFAELHEFASIYDESENPQGSLIISNSTLFGMTNNGGDFRKGTIFKIETDGTGFTSLHQFSGSNFDGSFPNGSLLVLGATLFGTTYKGGNSNMGTIFKIQTDGSGFSLLHSFAGDTTDGASPKADIILSDSTFYGMTEKGGDSNKGVIFSLPRFSISGMVSHDGLPLADVVMDGLPGNPVTDSHGFYLANVDVGWSGIATPARRYFTFDPSSATYSYIDGDMTTDYTATLSQSLVVASPTAGSVWEKGRAHAITWLKQGAQNANVKIALFKDASTLVQMIATATPNDGAYEWTIPSTMAVGKNYFIRVRTLDNLISDFSDRFSIIVPKIYVTAPTAGAVWVRGTTRAITWSKVGAQDSGVRILLYKDGIKKLDIALSAPNSGSFDWAIPSSLARGLYTVRVRTLDGKVTGTSKAFTIARN